MSRRAARARLLPELVVVLALGWGFAGLLTLIKGGSGSTLSFDHILAKADSNVWYRLVWFVSDFSEAQFYATVAGGLALVAGAWLAHRLDRGGSRWRGFSIAAGTGLWPSVLAASLLGLAISVGVYGFILADGEWIPTFVPFVSIPAGVVFVYGGGRRSILTGGILGGAIGFPIAYAVIKWVLEPLGYPAVIGNVTGMWLGGIVVFELCHRALPWMTPPDAPEPSEPTAQPTETETAPPEPIDRPGWLARRTLADFTEAQFYGNEIASAALLAGTTLSWVLNSGEAIYGTGVLPAVIAGQVTTSALGIVIWHERWRRLEWFPTFVPVVSVVPAVVLTYGDGAGKVVIAAVLGALLGPPVAQWVIDRIPGHWHPYVGNTFSMALSTAIVITVLVPFPGFTLPS
jgi:hypothetical protein